MHLKYWEPSYHKITILPVKPHSQHRHVLVRHSLEIQHLAGWLLPTVLVSKHLLKYLTVRLICYTLHPNNPRASRTMERLQALVVVTYPVSRLQQKPKLVSGSSRRSIQMLPNSPRANRLAKSLPLLPRLGVRRRCLLDVRFWVANLHV
jgi:hypothetical protein